MVVLGSKYEETKASLRKRIWSDSISALVTKSENHGCYFCNDPIEWPMFSVRENKVEGYNLCLPCYCDAKIYAFERKSLTPTYIN